MNVQSLRILMTGLLLMLIGAIGPISAQAQGLPSTPHTPDLLGIYPGMPLSQAQAMLQKHSATVYVKRDSSDSQLSLSIPDPKNPDFINVFMTQPPNDPYVWMVTRQWQYNPGAGGPGMSADALLAGLRQKYGKETLTWDRGGGGLYVYWLFDPSGKLLGSADPVLQNCEGTTFAGLAKTGPSVQPNDMEKACFGSFFGVKAFLNGGRGASLLNAYTVELMNLPYAYKAAKNLANAKNGAASKAQQDQLNRANQNTPTF
jgi:hypothetical protein